MPAREPSLLLQVANVRAGLPPDHGLHTVTVTAAELEAEGKSLDELVEFFTESIPTDGESSIRATLDRLARCIPGFQFRLHCEDNVLIGNSLSEVRHTD